MGSSWNIALGMGGAVYLGLRWEVLDSIERRLPPGKDDEVPEPRVLFYQLRTLEAEVLEVRNARAG